VGKCEYGEKKDESSTGRVWGVRVTACYCLARVLKHMKILFL
jgi:hypothetical protein